MANTNELSATLRNLTVDAEESATKTVAAAAQVLGTPELLEAILSHLPVLDLVIATGVSKTLRNAIQASSELQRKLFMLPSKDEPKYWQLVTPKLDDYRRGLHIAHLYRIICPGIVGDAEVQARIEAVTDDSHDWAHPNRSLKLVSICPLLDLSGGGGGSPIDLGLREMYGNERPVEIYLHPNSKALRVSKSWENMLITNPPCQEASMSLLWEGLVAGRLNKTMSVSGTARCEQGITLAFLVDKVAKTFGTVGISIREDEPKNTNVWKLSEAKDTTLYDQVDICRRSNSGRVWQMSTGSSIQLSSIVAPSRPLFVEMDFYGHVVTSTRRGST